MPYLFRFHGQILKNLVNVLSPPLNSPQNIFKIFDFTLQHLNYTLQLNQNKSN